MKPLESESPRAISTVLDVTLCLLLVSASVLTLAGTPLADDEENTRYAADAADETAGMVATSTAEVTYRVDGRERRVHDTLAGLLVSAARADTRPDDVSSARAGTNSTPAFVAAVTETVGRALRRPDFGVQVVARSVTGNGSQKDSGSPGGRVGSPIDSDESGDRRVVAGETPPPNADVHAAAFAVRRVRLTVRTWDR